MVILLYYCILVFFLIKQLPTKYLTLLKEARDTMYAGNYIDPMKAKDYLSKADEDLVDEEKYPSIFK
jgi:hypothetical protein